MMGRRERRCKQLLDDFKEKEDIGNKRGSTRSHCVKKWLWKRLLTYRETDYGKNEHKVTNGYKELIQSSQSYKVSFREA